MNREEQSSSLSFSLSLSLSLAKWRHGTVTNNWRKNGRGSRRIEEEWWYGEARGRSDNNLPSFEVRVSISLWKTCPLPVNYSELLAGKREREGGQPAGPTELFLDSSFMAKRRGTKGERLRLCALYTHTHTCLLTLFANERGFPIDQDVYACMLMFGKCIPFILETLFRYEEKGEEKRGEERESPSEEEIQCKYGSAIGAKLSTSRLSVIRTVLLLALAACTPRREKE